MARQALNDAFARTAFLDGANAAYIEDLYAQYQDNPGSVDDQWKHFFASLNDDRDAVMLEAHGPSWAEGIEPVHRKW